jgi:hypothetical protein
MERPMRRLLVLLTVVVVLGGGLLLADQAIAAAAEDRAEKRVSERIDADADVTLHGSFPGLRLLVGQPVRAEMTAAHVPLAGVPANLQSLDVTLTGVRLSVADLRDPPDDLPPADDGRFEARLDDAATFALAQVPRVVADLRIADGAVRLRVLGNEAAGDVQVRDGNIVIVPRTPLGALLTTDVPLDISGQPGDPRIEQAEIDGDVLIVRGVLQDLGRET